MRYTRISADCHIDLPWIPPDLFTSSASAEMKARMPYVTDGPDGPYWTLQERRLVRISFGESGIGWIPYALDRMDFEWEDRFRDLGLTMKPSDYWRRQCKATFQFDRIG